MAYAAKVRALTLLFFVAGFACARQGAPTGFGGRLHNRSGASLQNASVHLDKAGVHLSASVTTGGEYRFATVPPGAYLLSVHWEGGAARASQPLALPNDQPAEITVSGPGTLAIDFIAQTSRTGGEDLGSRQVSAIPLNKRDFGQLLLLAAGTMTDANGATNFTAQFAVNGQRGVEAVFALDGADSSDPEMGGATFSNFNVDAVSEIQSSSGWLPADIGRGAAGFSNIITRSGSNAFHGSLFEFVRNSAFDARNFFDRQSDVNPGRLPSFRRNEFGVTVGGPIRVPGFYDGRNRTFFYAQYQGFRQVLGTTQVIPVPTRAERSGLDITAFAGDTLYVPVNSQISAALNRYPLPNDPGGPFGTRTFASSSKVQTNAEQFSGRIDHRLTSKDVLFARVSVNNLNGPTTNPNQTVIDPGFGILYVDHQRNGVLTWTHTGSAHFVSESSLSFTRTTPSFPTPDHTDPALTFGDGLYEPFNAAAGSVTASLGNLFEARQNFTWTRSSHAIKAGAEFRANRDTTYFGTAPNGSYTFGGGTSYATTPIRSQTGAHNIAVGDALPDTLSALLTGSAFAYTVAVAPAAFPQGSQIGVAAASRYGVNFSWRTLGRFRPAFNSTMAFAMSCTRRSQNVLDALPECDSTVAPTQLDRNI